MKGSDWSMRGIKIRRDFLNYVLHQYDFNDRVAVWVVNFIKSHPTLIQSVRFIETSGIKKSLRISSKQTGRPSLILNKDELVITDGETIFHELRFNLDEPFLLTFNFELEDHKYDQLIHLEHRRLDVATRDELLQKIDEALDSQDARRFDELTHELKLLEEKSR